MARQGPGLPSTERSWSKARAGRSSFGSGGSSFGVGAHFAGLSVFSSGLSEVTVGLLAFKGAMAIAAVGFEVLTKSATELVGAMAQLGGAKGIQAMMVESVTNQSLMNQTRFSVSGEERSTSKELMDLTAKLSENSETGAFDRKEWLQTIREIGITTGHQKSLDEGTLGTLGKFAVVTGSSVEEQGQIFARLQAQNKNMNEDQIIQMMLNLHAVGQKGSFSEAELAKSPNLLGLRGMFSGDANTTMNMLGTVGSAFKGSGAATDENEAGTMFSSILNAAMRSKNPMWHRSGVTGQFGDPADILKDLVNTDQNTLQGELSKNGLGGSVLQKAVRGSVYLREQISQSAGVANDESPEAKSGRAKFIDDMINMHYTMKELNAEFDQTRGPQERFRAAFNRIADHLEGKFLGTLERMQPKLDAFAQVIINHESDIGNFFDKLAIWLGVAVEKFPAFMTAMMGLATAVGNAAEWILEKTTGAGRDNIDQRIKDTTDSLNDPNTYWNKPGASADDLKQKAIVEKNLRDYQILKSMYDSASQLTPGALDSTYADVAAKQAADEQKWDEEQKRKAREEGTGVRPSDAAAVASGGNDSFVKDMKAWLDRTTIAHEKNTAATERNTAATTQQYHGPPVVAPTSKTGK